VGEFFLGGFVTIRVFWSTSGYRYRILPQKRRGILGKREKSYTRGMPRKHLPGFGEKGDGPERKCQMKGRQHKKDFSLRKKKDKQQVRGKRRRKSVIIAERKVSQNFCEGAATLEGAAKRIGT